jgi:hypothetical protein
MLQHVLPNHTHKQWHNSAAVSDMKKGKRMRAQDVAIAAAVQGHADLVR